MALITQILDTEKDNLRHIHLFREGLFYRAYQHSAFQFINNIKNFKVVKKYYKAIDGDVVVLGFPTTMLGNLFPESVKIDVVEEGMHLQVECGPIDMKSYQVWFDTVQYAPEKPKKTKVLNVEELDFVPVESVDVVASGGRVWESQVNVPDRQREVLEEIRNFSIESATPLDCMIFLSKLKTKLRE